jgi:hypothetical protein
LSIFLAGWKERDRDLRITCSAHESDSNCYNPRAKLFALQLLGIGVQEAIRRPELAVAKRGQSIFRRFDILLSGGTITALEWRSSEITGLNLE